MISSKRDDFKRYLYEGNRQGSNKASSYIRALDLLCTLIERNSNGFGEVQNLWVVNNLNVLEDLYHFTKNESRKKDTSAWYYDDLPSSYLSKGFCSAALKEYHGYLVEIKLEQMVSEVYGDGIEAKPYEILDQIDELNYPDYFVQEMEVQEGIDKEYISKHRLNQKVFRRVVKANYSGKCCISGMGIQSINRASHIIGWAEDPSKRLDPRNGLYLSATYDAAFDKHLISLDNDFRVILSKEITEAPELANCPSIEKFFFDIEGQNIVLPQKNPPSRNYLEIHRKKGSF